MVDADLLVLLSDVPGLLDRDGRRVPLVRDIAREARPLAGASTSGVGTGGMASKVEAARRATLAGAAVVVADARDADPVGRVLAGDDVGTLFLPHRLRIGARKHWIAFTLRPRGAVLLDDGATAAIVEHGRSVLPVGVVGVRGDFAPGDAVTLLAHGGREIGRGLSRVSAADAAALAGKRGDEIAAQRGTDGDVVIVHRDDLVLAVDDT
jgi:glutamate 5-kinase